MGSDIFGISVSALGSAQLGLSTTEHNIANANTPGFNRQTIVINARPAQLTGAGFVGQGADVNSVKRIYDEFLSSQVIQQQGQAAQLNSYFAQIQQINNMLADPTAGLSPAMQDFFNSVNVVASSPESIPARQTMLSSAQALTSRFQSMNQQFINLNNSINGEIGTSVTNINGYARQIAALNQSIVMAQAASGGKPPNDLLDQRDQLITQLNQEVKVNIVKQGDGSLNVTVGSGQLLVVGATAYSLQTVQSLTDPSRLEVASGTPGGTVIRLQQSGIQGGNLGGLLNFRSQSLDPAQNMVGLVAMGVAGTFNQQHQLGQDLNGALGGNFFVQPSPVVNASSTNTALPPAIIDASVASYGALTGSDYTLRFDGGTAYTLTRLSDNTTTALPSLPQTIDGLTISVVSGAPNVGDSYSIRPTVNGALSIAVAITDPAKIAAAAPIRTNATLTNSGTGKISMGAVNAPPPVDVNLQQPVSIVFDNPPTTFTVTGVGVPGSPVTVPYTDGAPITYNGWTAQITGAPAAGDTFTVGPNTTATTDNRNALLLASLQIQSTMMGGTASYQGVYNQLVAQIGSKTRELDVTSTAQNTMVQQTIQAQQSVSGVNLDEEAANLMRYQRAYQAAGKAMEIANTMFDTLLTLGR
jgi:flagellar hook-associated protein 1 FlgK